MQRGLLLLGVVWASPWTLLGLTLGAITLVSGGRVQRHGRTLEFWGGIAEVLLRRVAGASAMTIGHTILGRTQLDLDGARAHELVHVRQYERWGPFFVPAYFLCAGYQWLAGRSPYFDNPFEREAFRKGAG
jgi:hypothetical protein